MQVYIAAHYLIICDIFYITRGGILSIYVNKRKMSLLQGMIYQFFSNNIIHYILNIKY